MLTAKDEASLPVLTGKSLVSVWDVWNGGPSCLCVST